MTPTGLIIGGKVMPCAVPVYNWHDTGLEFKPGQGGRARAKKQIIDLFVFHWTAGEGNVFSLYDVLHNRELGVEFFIDYDAVHTEARLYQFADPILVDTYDASQYNRRSVGCEIRNYGFSGPGRATPDPRRSVYETVQNGKLQTFAAFYPKQLETALALANAVSDAIPTIPRAVPTIAGKLCQNLISDQRMTTIRGHIGHYMINPEKKDPGADLLTYFLTHGFSGVEV